MNESEYDSFAHQLAALACAVSASVVAWCFVLTALGLVPIL